MGEHRRNGVSLLNAAGQLPPRPTPETLDLERRAVMAAVACPRCRRTGVEVPVYALGVGGGRSALFCVFCLLPALSALVPPMVETASLPPLEDAPDGD